MGSESAYCRRGSSIHIHPLLPTSDKGNQEEYNLLSALAPIPTSSLVATTFSSLITPLISLFKSTLSSLNTSIKRSLQKHTFLVLSTYTSLSESETHWEDLMCRRAGRRENELKDALSSLRSVCLRSFPELIANIKAGALGKGGELGTSVADFVISVSPPVFVLAPDGSPDLVGRLWNSLNVCQR